MHKTASVVLVLAFATVACGSSDSSEIAWCEDNPDIVVDAADDLGLVDFVISYYESAGDGLGADGDPIETDRNVEISEDLRTRNENDRDALIDFLYAEYLEQDAGKTACAAAYAEEG